PVDTLASPEVTSPTPVLSFALASPEVALAFTLLVILPVFDSLILAVLSLLTVAVLVELAPVFVICALPVRSPEVLSPPPGNVIIFQIQCPRPFTITSTALSPKTELFTRFSVLPTADALPLATSPTLPLSPAATEPD